MIPYFHQTPQWLKSWFPTMTWEKPTSAKIIHLTFDDGPIPQVTPYVLQALDDFDAKATFFCVGENITKHPKIFKEVKDAGHSFGNHTYHHLNGWKTDSDDYWKDIIKCDEVMKSHKVSTGLFRPPYGRIRKEQRKLVEEKYEIIMWSHLSGDFDPNLKVNKSMNAMQKATKGSVLVFHDSFKAAHNLKKLLPDVLSFFQDHGYQFKSL